MKLRVVACIIINKIDNADYEYQQYVCHASFQSFKPHSTFILVLDNLVSLCSVQAFELFQRTKGTLDIASFLIMPIQRMYIALAIYVAFDA